MATKTVFITGGTGYIERRLIPRLLIHMLAALVQSVENSASGIRVLEVSAIRNGGFSAKPN